MKIMVLLCTAFAAGIWCGGIVTWPQTLVQTLVIFIFLVSLWCIYKKHQMSAYIIVLLFFMIGMLRFIQDSSLSPVDISNYHEEVVTAGGIISEVPEVKQRDSQAVIKYVVDVKSAQVNGNIRAAAGRMFVYIRQLPDETVLRYGDLVEVTGQVFLPHGYNNPGLVDSAAALRRQGITARMSGAVIKRAERGKESTNWPIMHALWRERISSMVRSVMPEKDAAILQGMLFGGYEGIPAEVGSADNFV